MIQETIANTGAVPREVSADAGYYSATAVADLQALGTTPTSRRRRPATATNRRPHPEDASPRTSRPETGCAVRHRRTGPAGSPALCVAHGDGGAGLRPDQAGPRVPAVPATGLAEGERQMVPDLHRAQPAQAVPPLPPVGPAHTVKPANRVNRAHHMAPSVVSGNPRTGC